MKKLIYCILIVISACSSPYSVSEYSLNEKFDKMMEKSSKRCLNRGFYGHEPEYRSCVIKGASDLLNVNASKISRNSSFL